MAVFFAPEYCFPCFVYIFAKKLKFVLTITLGVTIIVIAGGKMIFET